MQKFFIGVILFSMPLFADDLGINDDFQDVLIVADEPLDLVAQAPRKAKEYYVSQETLNVDPKASKGSLPPDPYDEQQGPFFTGEFIYWKTHSTRMPIASTDVIVPPLGGPGPGIGVSKKTYEARFGYDWGYRAGVGYRFPYREWDILGNWTYFQTSGERTVSPNEGETVSNIWGSLNFSYDLDRSHGKQEIRLNTFDFELGKNIHFTPPFCVRPFIGCKLAWIDQSFNVDNQIPDLTPNVVRAHYHFDNNFRGVGLRLGVNTDWDIAKGFAILGRAAYSILWGKLGLSHSEHYEFLPPGPLTPPPLDFNFHDGRHITQSVMELFAGVRWERVYNHDKYRFRIQGGYEAQYWPSFNQLTRVTEAAGSLNSDIVIPFTGDLGFHGWTAGVRFDF